MKERLCSWMEGINVVKMTILPKAVHSFKCNCCQITNDIFHRPRRKSFGLCVERQKTQNSKNSLEKEEWSRRIMLPTKYCTSEHSRQNGVVLAQKQTPRAKAHNRKPRNKHTLLWSVSP